MTWEVERICWNAKIATLPDMLRAGWEPFAVVPGSTRADDTIYVRRPRPEPFAVPRGTQVIR